MLHAFPRSRQPDDARACLVSARAAARHARLPLAEVIHRSRHSRDSAAARALAMYLAHVGLGLPLARVAAGFGRHRSTVAHACRLVEEQREAMFWDKRIGALEDEVRRETAGEDANDQA